LASPATFRNLPELLLDRHSPLFIPLRYRLQIVPWLWRFALSCREDCFLKGVRALAHLNSMLWDCTDDLYGRVGIFDCLDKSSALFLYESEKSYRQALKGWALAGEFGIQTKTVGVEQLAKLEPELTQKFAGAVAADSWGVVSDTLKIVSDISKYATDKGAHLMRDGVQEIMTTADGVEVVLESGQRLPMDGAVIAAGAWSKQLTRQLGERIPVEVERGYNITLARSQTAINHALVFADRGAVATQLSGALRIGGLDELGGLELPANPALHQHVLAMAEEHFSGLDFSTATPWIGHRPSMPDSLPVIGHAQKSERILYAFGHGHYGLTHAPATGRLIADLASAKPPAISIEPFSSTRFM
jgi:D-amino-acid dehydrogenase